MIVIIIPPRRVYYAQRELEAVEMRTFDEDRDPISPAGSSPIRV